MTTLTQAQSDLLAEAAKAPDAGVEAPDDAKTIKPLIKQGLLISLPQAAGPSRLLLTDAGRAAIGLAPEIGDTPISEPEPEAQPAAAAATAPTQPVALKPGLPKGKLGLLVVLLSRPEGVDLETMVSATGWQAHSVRGALSGSLKKKLGYEIVSEKTEQNRIYRIAAAIVGAGEAQGEAAQ